METNPISNDTDSDSLSDGWEEVRFNDSYGVNPVLTAIEIDLTIDADRDDFNLLEEGKANTDPEDPDPNNPDPRLMNTTTNTISAMNSGTLEIEIGEESSITLLEIFIFSTSIVLVALVLYSVRRRMT